MIERGPRLSIAELEAIALDTASPLAALAAEVVKLRRLLIEIYPLVHEQKGTEGLQASLDRAVAEIRAAERGPKRPTS